jgi:hypothetical protein
MAPMIGFRKHRPHSTRVFPQPARQQRGTNLAYTRLPGSFAQVIPPPKLYGFPVSSAVPLHLEAESMGWLNGAMS